MDGGVPDSDDEGHPSYHSNRHDAYAGNEPLEKIYSDDEGDAWAIAANYSTRLEATPQPQAPANRFQKMFTLGRKATLTGAVKGPRQQAGRRLVSSAVAARQQASAIVEETTQQEDDLGGIDWSLGFGSLGGITSQISKQSVPAPLIATRPAFVGRAPPPAFRPLSEARRAPAVSPPSTAAPGPTEQDNVNKPRSDAAPRVEQTDRSTAPQATSNKPSYAPPPTATVAGANFGAGMTTHRNDDGMNVIFSKRKRSGDDETTAPATKTRATVNSGWGNNFVRIDMKVG
jgi:hypothetical protein